MSVQLGSKDIYSSFRKRRVFKSLQFSVKKEGNSKIKGTEKRYRLYWQLGFELGDNINPNILKLMEEDKLVQVSTVVFI